MANVFCLIVDALANNYINEKNMPFLCSLKKNGRDCVNVYSQGPYTEAALTPFYTGCDNMDGGGNYFRGEASEGTLFGSVERAGYRAYCYTQPLIYPQAMHRDIEFERYGVSYFFSAVYEYRLKHYRDLFLSGSIEKEDLANIEKLLEGNFEFWLSYLVGCRDGDARCAFVNKFSDYFAYDFDRNIALVSGEYAKFKICPEDYVHQLYLQEYSHPVFSIPKYEMMCKSDNQALLESAWEKHLDFFEVVSSFNRRHQRRGIIDQIVDCVVGNGEARTSQTIYDLAKIMYYNLKLRSTKKTLCEMREKGSAYKAEPSMWAYFEDFLDWEEGSRDSRPFFCMMHVSDLHTPMTFLTYDSNDAGFVEADMLAARELVDSIDEFDGDVLYDLSMRYVDRCMELMYGVLVERYGVDNIVFAVTSDHGSSFKFSPIRPEVVNNCHEENYHIPFVIKGPAEVIAPCVDERYYTTKDISKTLAWLCGSDFKFSTGVSVFDESAERSMAISEYLGGGCPDIKRKPIQFVARDDRWAVHVEQFLSGDFENGNLRAIYDRVEDPLETKNLVNNEYARNSVGYLVEVVKCRWLAIRSQNSLV